ncbi:ATP-binding protein [Streptomyces sp. F63]|uniref:ATP-binding protein n=1 Tax=Streptomyces sp. F63 TaxID=2824887 RepID=UPI001B36962A|nr:ATP-binding protein [Streptomyces sp. F63]MBQ0983731.1 ATP-binding protein [Streptomyces sp. F63]
MNARPATSETPYVLWRWTSRSTNAAATARAALRCALEQLGYEGEAIGEAVLVASELVTNATEHAVGPYEIRLRSAVAEWICEIEDHDPRIPEIPPFPAVAPYVPAEPDRGGGLDALCALLTERGRGLHMVQHLTQGSWGFTADRTTKVAWFALPPCPRERSSLR